MTGLFSVRKKGKVLLPLTVLLISWLLPIYLLGQKQDSLLEVATLENVIEYGLKNQPLIQQSYIDQTITEKAIRSRLADWYPQINFVYNYQRNFQLPTSIIGGNPIRFGVHNVSATQFNLTQNFFNRDALLAYKTSDEVRLYAEQSTVSKKIDLAVALTKAFYDVLATSQQIKVGEGDVVRLQRSLRDALNQYNAGITDKTDYKRATITLSNTKATLKSNREILNYKVEYLKSLMGYPAGGYLMISYDTLQMENEIALDTLQQVDYTARIDYKILSTQRKLQLANVRYNQWSFIPSLSGFASLISNYQNNNFNELYDRRYPNSYVGATLTVPVFQGGKRRANIAQQQWGLKRIDWDITSLKNAVNAQYALALALYKANLVTYQTIKENVELAKEVYDIIQLQYKTGVKTYLEVITAETDLRTARINYFNSLYQLLVSKVDVQKALGQINY